MRGSLAGGLLALALVAGCAQPAPPLPGQAPREGRGLAEAPTPPPRPPHKPPVPETEPALRTPPGEAADALSAATPSAGPTSAPTAPSAPPAPDATPAPDQSAAPAAAATPTSPPTPPQTASVEPPPEAPPPPPPPRLIGLNQAQIRNLLGAPAGREDAAPATIWRYPSRNCDLAIYFYFDLKSQVMRALQYEVDTHGSDEFTGERCFAELVTAHQANPQGSAGTDTPR